MKNAPAVIPTRQFAVSRGIWIFIAGLSCADICLAWLTGFQIKWPVVLLFAGVAALLWLASMACRHLLKDEPAALFANLFSQSLVYPVPAAILSYITATSNRPFIDDTLIAADRFLGFDWLAFIHWWDRQPILLTDAITTSYQLMLLQSYALIIALSERNHLAHAQRYFMAILLTELCTLTLAAVFPALGGFGYYDIDISMLKHFIPAGGRLHEAALLGLRNHTLTTIHYPAAGLIAFPSFHAVMAVLLIYASLPLRWFRWFVIPLNILMLFSCLSDGGHYLVDVLAGIVIALGGIWAAEKILPRTLTLATPASLRVPAYPF